jgi:hypothetical protein
MTRAHVRLVAACEPRTNSRGREVEDVESCVVVSGDDDDPAPRPRPPAWAASAR